MKENDRLQVILEDLKSKLDAILELVQSVPQLQLDTAGIREDLAEARDDIKVIKSVIRQHSAEILQLKAKT